MDDKLREAQVQTTLHLTMLTCGVHALMASHPDPGLLREAWNREMAELWAHHSKVFAGRENPYSEQLRSFQAACEAQMGAAPQ